MRVNDQPQIQMMEPAEEYDDEEENLPAAVRRVKREWNVELAHQQHVARSQEEELRLRHLQDIEVPAPALFTAVPLLPTAVPDQPSKA